MKLHDEGVIRYNRMLDVRRSGITVVARTLGKPGLIRYARGEITILDRDGLVRAPLAQRLLRIPEAGEPVLALASSPDSLLRIMYIMLNNLRDWCHPQSIPPIHPHGLFDRRRGRFSL